MWAGAKPRSPPRNVVGGHYQAPRGEEAQGTRHGRVPDIPQETCEMIISLVREAEAHEMEAYYDWHLTNLMAAAVIFFRASRHRLPEGLGNLMGPNGGVKWSTIEICHMRRLGTVCKTTIA